MTRFILNLFLHSLPHIIDYVMGKAVSKPMRQKIVRIIRKQIGVHFPPPRDWPK